MGIPLREQLKDYNSTKLRGDLNAGILVGIILIPQAMAYAQLAGIQPIYGLYASIIPLIIYSILGTSRQLSIGPVAITSILVLSGLGSFSEPFSAEYVQSAILIGICAGVIQLLFGLIRLGFITHFLSYPVILGFTSAAAVIIGISQLSDATGIDLSYVSHRLLKVVGIIEQVSSISGYTFSIFLSAILIILGLQKLNKKIPGALIVVVVSIALSYFLFQDRGVAVVGSIPGDLPKLQIPNVDFVSLINQQWVTILSIAVIGIVEHMSIARTLESKHQSYRLNTNQELIAIGTSKIIGGFFQAMPSSASFSRSAINDDAGAKSTVATLITALIILLTLLFLTPLFTFLPKAVLAAIIIVSIRGLVKPDEILRLYKISKPDFLMMSVTFITTILIGITYGVLFGVVLSLLAVLYRSSTPEVNILGNLPDTDYYRNMIRYPEARSIDEILIIRFDDQLYFGNCNHFTYCIEKYIQECQRNIHHLILDAGNIHFIDSSGIKTLRDINDWLARRKIELHIARAIGPVRDVLERSDLMKRSECHHMNVHSAVLSITMKNDNKVNGVKL